MNPLVRLAAPKLTEVAPVKPVPVMVTAFPPAMGPVLGRCAVTVGRGGGVTSIQATILAHPPLPVTCSAGRAHQAIRRGPGCGDGAPVIGVGDDHLQRAGDGVLAFPVAGSIHGEVAPLTWS